MSVSMVIGEILLQFFFLIIFFLNCHDAFANIQLCLVTHQFLDMSIF